MTPATRFYVGAVIGAGALALVAGAPRTYDQPMLALTYLAAMLVASVFKLRLPLGRGASTMSMAYVIDFAVIVTAGPGLAMVIAAAGVLAQCTIRVRRRQPWYRAAFSVAAVVLAIQGAAWIWTALGGSVAEISVDRTVFPLLLAAVVYFAVNTGLVAGAIALSTGATPASLWRHYFATTAPAYLVAAGAATAIQLMLARELYLLMPAAVVPLVVCHLAYAFWFRQIAARPPAPALT